MNRFINKNKTTVLLLQVVPVFKILNRYAPLKNMIRLCETAMLLIQYKSHSPTFYYFKFLC